MSKITKFISKYYKLIIGGLVIVIFFQACNSCSKRQTIAFSEYERVQLRDSLNYIISNQQDSILVLKAEIDKLNSLNSRDREVIDALNNDKKHLKDINRKLANKE